MNRFHQYGCTLLGWTMVLCPVALAHKVQTTHLESNSGKYEVTLEFPTPLTVGRNTYGIHLREGRLHRTLNVNTMVIVEKHLVTYKRLHNRSYTHWISAPVRLQKTDHSGNYKVTTTFTKPGPWTIQVLPGANPKRRISDDIYFHVIVRQAT